MRVVLLAVDSDLSSKLIPPDAEVLVIPNLASYQRSRSILQDFAPDFVVCGPQVIPQMNASLDLSRGLAAPPREETQAVRAKLNKRHRDILSLLHCGLQNREIAAQLGLSARTVKAYISQLFMIFDVSNRTELVARADDLRILDTELGNVMPIRATDNAPQPHRLVARAQTAAM